MSDAAARRRSPPLTTVIATALVVAGVGLGLFVAMGFLILAGLGAFGPGILRELGWLRDQDEFERLASYRAGYLAYLAGGFAAVVTVAMLRWSAADLEEGAVWVVLVLAVMGLTWLFSSLLAYWGARKTTARVLVVAGSFWALFVIGGHLREPGALLWETAFFVAPFFVLAWMAGRWPRTTGALLLGVAAVLFGWIFDFGRQFIEWPTQVLTFILLLIPMLACGLALLREWDSRSDG